MIYPKSLENGTKIGVTATSAGLADPLDWVRIDSGIRHFKELGYPVLETDNVRRYYKGRSSDGSTRAKELMELFKDKEVRAVITATGGDYLVEMLTYIDFQLLGENPTWLQGYSDTTGITFTVTTNLDMATIYGSNFGSFGMEHWHSSLVNNVAMLEGKDIIQFSFDKYQDGFVKIVTGLEEYVLGKNVIWKTINFQNTEGRDEKYSSSTNKLCGLVPNSVNAKNVRRNEEEDEVIIKGRAIGGCLDVLLNLVGTRFDKTREFVEKYKQDGILWFLESFDLNSEALTRGLWQLKEAGWFEHAVGFMFGRPAMFSTSTDTSYEEAVLSALGEFNLPIILEADIGHKPPQFTMINGAIASIKSTGKKGEISFERR